MLWPFSLLMKKRVPEPQDGIVRFISVSFYKAKYYFSDDVRWGAGGPLCSIGAGPVIACDDREGLTAVIAERMAIDNEIVLKSPWPEQTICATAGFRTMAEFDRASENVTFMEKAEGLWSVSYGGPDSDYSEDLGRCGPEQMAEWLVDIREVLEDIIDNGWNY